MTTFELLHPDLQEIIRRMEWESFKPIQDESIHYLSSNTSDLLIVAPTASGKTEAAFLPIISSILDQPKPSIRILYISPLKALINDQFSRVLELCKLTNITVTKWHGDADNSKKQKLVKQPEGILLITPESLEALLINKTEYISSMFQYLDYIVIDEIHNFAINERGSQLNSLLNRIQHLLKKDIQKIGLSATLSDDGINDIKQWLLNCANKNHEIKSIVDNSNKNIQGIIKSYIVKTDDKDIPIETSLSDDLLSILINKKSLIFANNKNLLEEYCDELRDKCTESYNSLVVGIHHGSLSKEIREETEYQLKNSQSIAVFCTNTLELGIDISNIDQIIFLQAPFSVSSLTQRLGRSGRSENSKKIFRFFLQRTDDNDIDSKIESHIIQSIALIELMLEDWFEPLPFINYDYSTYTHQLLSYLRMTGGIHALKLYNYLSKVYRFDQLSEEKFILLLRSLKEKKVIYQDSANNISLDQLGEKITEYHTFYAAFSTSKEWKLIYNGTEIGSIPKLPLGFDINEQNLLIAGKRWKIIEIKEETNIILICPSKFKKPIVFVSGNFKIHQEIHRKMYKIYENKFIPKYIDINTENSLKQAFQIYDLSCKQESNVLFVFEGSVIQNTIGLILKYLDVEYGRCNVGFILSQDKKTIITRLKEIDWDVLTEKDLCSLLTRSNKESRKFDYLLPDEILDISYTKEWIDINGARQLINIL